MSIREEVARTPFQIVLDHESEIGRAKSFEERQRIRKDTAELIEAHAAEREAAAVERAAGYHDAQAANARLRYGELNRYSDCSDEREGWRSWKDAEDRHRSYAAGIRKIGTNS